MTRSEYPQSRTTALALVVIVAGCASNAQQPAASTDLGSDGGDAVVAVTDGGDDGETDDASSDDASSDDASSGDGVSAADVKDTSETGDAGDSDAGGGADASVDAGPPLPAAIPICKQATGCACTNNSDCTGGSCVATVGGKACGAPCHGWESWWTHTGTSAYAGKEEQLSDVEHVLAGAGTIAAGSTKTGENQWNYQGILLRRNLDGAVLWAHTYKSKKSETTALFDLAATADGGAWAVGETISAGWVMRVDANGKMIVDRPVKKSVATTYRGVDRWAKGSVVACGWNKIPKGAYYGIITYFDANMNVAITQPYLHRFYADCVYDPKSDSTFVVGSTSSYAKIYKFEQGKITASFEWNVGASFGTIAPLPDGKLLVGGSRTIQGNDAGVLFTFDKSLSKPLQQIQFSSDWIRRVSAVDATPGMAAVAGLRYDSPTKSYRAVVARFPLPLTDKPTWSLEHGNGQGFRVYHGVSIGPHGALVAVGAGRVEPEGYDDDTVALSVLPMGATSCAAP